MASTYKSTIPVNCWKQHTCAACEANYSYLLSRKAVGTGRTPDKARLSMQKRVAQIMKSETDMQPCPGCGLYQFDMIGQRRAKSRRQFIWAAAICMVLVTFTKLADGLGAQTLNWIGILCFGALILFHLLLDLSNANHDLTANAALGQQRVREGKIHYTPGSGETAAESLARPQRSLMHNMALVILLMSMVFVSIPEATRLLRGWPINSQCYPPVVGASDQTRVYLPQSIVSIKGFWRGTPTVTMHYDGGPFDGLNIEAAANQNSWGSTIEDVHPSEKSSISHPWVEMRMPESPDMEGKTVRCDIDLNLEYPEVSSTDSSKFHRIHTHMRHRLNIEMASVGAGLQYNNLWWTGIGGGGTLLLVGSLMLYWQARSFQGLAKPSIVLPSDPLYDMPENVDLVV